MSRLWIKRCPPLAPQFLVAAVVGLALTIVFGLAGASAQSGEANDGETVQAPAEDASTTTTAGAPSSTESSGSSTSTTQATGPATPTDNTEGSSGQGGSTTTSESTTGEPTASTQPRSGQGVTPTTGLNDQDGTGDDSVGSSTTSTTADPLINEHPRDSDPVDPNVTVPPPAYDHVLFQPAPVLWSSVNAAEEKLVELRLQRRESIVAVRTLRKRHKELEHSRLALGEGSGQAVADFNTAAERLRDRAIIGYVELSSGNSQGLDFGFDLTAIPDVIDNQRKGRFLAAALSVDRQTMDTFIDLKTQLDADSIDLVEHGRVVRVALSSAERRTSELSAEVDQALIEAEAFRAGSEIYVDGVVFPIAGSYSTPLIDSFGFPRMPGTADAHAHEGIDIFAPRGTPLVAAERGVVVRIGNGRLGGLKFWLRGESGADWYYAHLDSFAPGLHNGQVVQAGELLGYVGNTGNAISTPPHLHLEIHPGGGRAVNPYPLLRIVSDLDLDAVASGTHPGFRYQPRIVSRGTPSADGSESTTSSSSSTTGSQPPTTEQGQSDDTSPSTTAQGPSSTTDADRGSTTTNAAPGSTSTTADTTPGDNSSVTSDLQRAVQKPDSSAQNDGNTQGSGNNGQDSSGATTSDEPSP